MPSIMTTATAGAAPQGGTDTTALILVLVGVGGLILFVYIASKLMGRPDPEITEEYPLPLDLDDD